MKLSIFAGLSEPEIDLVASCGKQLEFQEKDIIFQEGDQGRALFVVLEGAIQISTVVLEDLEKPIVTLSKGGVFGEVSLIDQNPREVRATAMTASTLLQINAEDFENVLNAHPQLGSKIYKILTRSVVHRIRATVDQYRRNIQWGLSVSGALKLNWQRLITDEVELTADLSNGKQIQGTFLKVEESSGGLELFIQTPAGKVLIVPYHAIVSLMFNREDTRTQQLAASDKR